MTKLDTRIGLNKGKELYREVISGIDKIKLPSLNLTKYIELKMESSLIV